MMDDWSALADRSWLTDARAYVAAAAFAASALVTGLGGWLGTRVGWIDRRDAATAERKPRTTPIPQVGGIAVLLGLAAGAAVAAGAGASAGPERAFALPWPALAAAFAVGLLDDLRRGGLSPLAKLVGQSVAALLLALDPGAALELAPGIAPRAALFVVALVAQNALNTYDNSDGAATSLALAGLFPLPAACGALAGFLPFNLLGLRPVEPPARGSGDGAGAGGSGDLTVTEVARETRVPWAYLGDSGSHLLGVLVAAHPPAWPVLILPVVDLARLVRLRRARGRPPWRGDRSHLAHRMAAADWPAPAVALTLAAVAALPILGGLLGGPEGDGSPQGRLAGALGVILAFCLLVVCTPDPEA